jgi:hypothetical protein
MSIGSPSDRWSAVGRCGAEATDCRIIGTAQITMRLDPPRLKRYLGMDRDIFLAFEEPAVSPVSNFDFSIVGYKLRYGVERDRFRTERGDQS